MLLETVLVLASVTASPSSTPRMLVSLRASASGNVDVTIENLSAETLAIRARTYLTLASKQAGVSLEPRHWAEVSAPPLPIPTRPMRLKGRARVALSLDVTDLLWAPDRSGFSVAQPLARGVPPGEYELQLQIVDESGNWWRSAGISVRI